VQLLELGNELRPGHLGGGEVTDDDVGDERDPEGIGGACGGDDRAGELEHRAKEVAGELLVVDHQHVNASKLGQRCTGHN